MAPRRKVRYAVVGLGYISQVAVLPAFRNATRNSELTALVSGSPAKLDALGDRYGVERRYSYENFADCLEQVDAIYVALPNHLHRAYSVAAARAGVHVLCEKPLAVSVEDAEAMIEEAERNDVRLMTAYRLHFEAGTLKTLELARSGALGKLRFFHSAFSMQVAAGNIRLGPEAEGGGPLYDLGVYCINAARHLFGAEPVEVSAFTANDGEQRFAETHEMISCLLRFPEERIANFTVSAGAADAGWYEIVGSKGRLRMDPAFEYAEPLERRLEAEGRRVRSRYGKRDQFAPELLHFSDCVLRKRKPEPSGAEGLADVRVVAALLESVRSGRPVGLPEMPVAARPSARLARRSPPVDRPELVDAAPPSRKE
jgi:predicted dehydrogenase